MIEGSWSGGVNVVLVLFHEAGKLLLSRKCLQANRKLDWPQSTKLGNSLV